MKKTLILIISILLVNQLFSQSITNVSPKLEGHKIAVTYNLQSDAAADISLFISEDGGKTFTGPLKQVSGDIGTIQPGTNKKITWDVLKERKILHGNNIVFRVKAEPIKGLITETTSFLTKNAKRDEVITLPSGLQYEILVEGNGPKPTSTSTVKTHYRGTFIDGRVFDSSYDRGEPTLFPLNRVIAGWTEALQLMPVGSKWKIYIPYHLAYGERGAGQLIGPFETLIFEIELLDIEN